MITRRKMLKNIGGIGLGVAGLGVFPGIVRAKQDMPGLPGTMVWSSYDLGSSGYSEASAMGNALREVFGTRIRLLPSGTSIGLVNPIVEKKTDFGLISTEASFAAEGLFEFCKPEYGPRDLTVLMGRSNAQGVAVYGDSDIKKMSDLRGRKVALPQGSTGTVERLKSSLAFGGLTMDDVEIIPFPGYGPTLKGLNEGQVEAVIASVMGPALRELESSSHGIRWLATAPEDTEGWKRVREITPFVGPVQAKVGAGVSEDNPVWVFGYKYPMIVTRADHDEEAVYSLMKALHESYDKYKDATPVMPEWQIEKATQIPLDNRFHDGAVRYLKEIGLWSDDHEEWQDYMVRRSKAIKSAWDEFVNSDAAKQAKGDEFCDLWEQEHARVTKGLG